MNDNFPNNQIKNQNQPQTQELSKQLQSQDQSLSQQLNNANRSSSSQPESVSTIRGEDYNELPNFENNLFVVISQHSSQQYPTPQLLSENEEDILTEFSDSGSERIHYIFDEENM